MSKAQSNPKHQNVMVFLKYFVAQTLKSKSIFQINKLYFDCLFVKANFKKSCLIFSLQRHRLTGSSMQTFTKIKIFISRNCLPNPNMHDMYQTKPKTVFCKRLMSRKSSEISMIHSQILKGQAKRHLENVAAGLLALQFLPQ